MVDLLGGPAADMTAAVQEDFKQADDARVVDLDPGIADRADGDWQGQALQQRKVDMDIEPLRLEAGKAIGDGLETLATQSVCAGLVNRVTYSLSEMPSTASSRLRRS